IVAIQSVLIAYRTRTPASCSSEVVVVEDDVSLIAIVETRNESTEVSGERDGTRFSAFRNHDFHDRLVYVIQAGNGSSRKRHGDWLEDILSANHNRLSELCIFLLHGVCHRWRKIYREVVQQLLIIFENHTDGICKFYRSLARHRYDNGCVGDKSRRQ